MANTLGGVEIKVVAGSIVDAMKAEIDRRVAGGMTRKQAIKGVCSEVNEYLFWMQRNPTL